MSDEEKNTNVTNSTGAATTNAAASAAGAPAKTDGAVAATTNAADDAAKAAADATAKANEGLEADMARAKDRLEVEGEIRQRIAEAQNVLVALSADPSVDEMAAAIGLSLYLDRMGKRATAIYSGATPNALEFLKPDETFENSTDSLQDFVIALNKDKADHLRYKLDGDFVKIFITPYRTKIAEEDLDFSYGDFNIDLVLALDVANGADLDSALREHGRIMHDAVIVNITTGKPGKLAEIEWSDKSASSVSEMIANLLHGMKERTPFEKEEATAFLTGIVAATNRFANAATTPETMATAAWLMDAGADQQLVSKNITAEVENEMGGFMNPKEKKVAEENSEEVIEEEPVEKEETDSTDLQIDHNEEESLLDDLKAAEETLATTGAETTPEVKKEAVKVEELGDLDAAAKEVAEAEKNGNLESAGSSAGLAGSESLAGSAETSDSTENSTESLTDGLANDLTGDSTNESVGAENAEVKMPGDEGFIAESPEKVIAPPAEMASEYVAADEGGKYGKMLEEALNEVGAGESQLPPITSAPTENTAITGGATENLATAGVAAGMATENSAMAGATMGNPALAAAPTVPANPEVNGVPEMNYMPMPGDQVLPPPPTPPINMNAAGMPAPDISVPGALPAVDAAASATSAASGLGSASGSGSSLGSASTITSTAPAASATSTTPVVSAPTNIEPIQPALPKVELTPTSLGNQPAMQDQVYTPQAADPGAFKIPGA